MGRYVKCCKHNLCPQRPSWRLGRFVTRPWVCPQCGRTWLTKWRATYEGGEYFWVQTGWMEVVKDEVS